MDEAEIRIAARRETLTELAKVVVGLALGGRLLGGMPGEILLGLCLAHALVFAVFLVLYVKDLLHRAQ